jgi:DNA mismatch repair protein MSH2
VLREHAKYVTLSTLKDGVRFTSNKLKAASKGYHDLMTKYNEIQDDIVMNAMTIVISYTPVLERANSLLAELDVLLAFAHVAVNAPQTYQRPIILPAGSGTFELIGCRHPVGVLLFSSFSSFIHSPILTVVVLLLCCVLIDSVWKWSMVCNL